MGWAESTYSSHFSPSSESGKIRLLFKHVLGRLTKLSEFLTAMWLEIQVFWAVPLSFVDQFPMFWTWRHYSLSDCLDTLTQWHGITSQKTWIFRINMFCSFTLTVLPEYRVKFWDSCSSNCEEYFFMWHLIVW